MTPRPPFGILFAVALSAACHGSQSEDPGDAGAPADLAMTMDASTTPCTTAADCEAATAARMTAAASDPAALLAFMTAMPKGGDLHNHLSGAIYAETYLDWAKADGDCVNTTTFTAAYGSSCGASTMPAPTMGAFFDQIVAAWSMQGFVAGAENGHDHFFATFGKYGAVAGAHRDDSLADIVKRAGDENQLYIETMFNLGKNVGTLAASTWSGTVTADMLPAFYDMLVAAPTFAAQVDADAAVVTGAAANYRGTLGCGGASPPAACSVGVRFVAQVSRTGANDTLFGQLVSAYEMAAKAGATSQIVALNLSSPEDDTTSLKNYDLHMAMLDFLYNKYTVTQKSPLHVTLHAGELVPQYLPAAYSTANTFHVRHAVEMGHAERIGHGVDVLSETDPEGLLAEMAAKNVLVEVCLSSNAQILGVSGAAHPLATYLSHGVPVALATDDQGVSRSSLAGEYVRAATDQQLGYVQLKALTRNSLEHAFLPGTSLWTAIGTLSTVADCAPTATMRIGDPAGTACAAFLATSEKATMQWELERRFLAFESAQ